MHRREAVESGEEHRTETRPPGSDHVVEQVADMRSGFGGRTETGHRESKRLGSRLRPRVLRREYGVVEER